MYSRRIFVAIFESDSDSTLDATLHCKCKFPAISWRLFLTEVKQRTPPLLAKHYIRLNSTYVTGCDTK